jgi:hypothetical protein
MRVDPPPGRAEGRPAEIIVNPPPGRAEGRPAEIIVNPS